MSCSGLRQLCTVPLIPYRLGESPYQIGPILSMGTVSGSLVTNATLHRSQRSDREAAAQAIDLVAQSTTSNCSLGPAGSALGLSERLMLYSVAAPLLVTVTRDCVGDLSLGRIQRTGFTHDFVTLDAAEVESIAWICEVLQYCCDRSGAAAFGDESCEATRHVRAL